VDLAAPGVEIPIATAIGKGWRVGDGTSFAAPLVSGASAWVWTARPELDATQLFEVMRRSATDVGVVGRDDAAGFGLLNVPAALAYPAPVRDPFEPNDDIDFVQVDGIYYNSIPPLTTKTRKSTTVQARMDRVEDPRDVYRVWLPRNGRFTATLTADANVDLSLWKQGTLSVKQRTVGTDRLARATTGGTSELLTFANKGPGRFAFLAVVFPNGPREATYRLRVS
jgi:subtilisin family serine protease